MFFTNSALRKPPIARPLVKCDWQSMMKYSLFGNFSAVAAASHVSISSTSQTLLAKILFWARKHVARPIVLAIKARRSVVNPHHWQQGARRMSPVVMNRIGRDLSLFVSPQGLAGVRVRIKARIVRTADVNRDAMTLVEDQARRPEIDVELIDLALLHEDLVVKTFTEARSKG